jgi:hypothetical protein
LFYYYNTKTKRNLIPIWLLCAALLPVAVNAQFTFTSNNDGSLNISRYRGPGGTVVIPSTTNGLPVTSIGSSAFAFTPSLTNVMIPDSITNIGSGAFEFFYVVGGAIYPVPSGLVAITVDTNNPVYASVNGVLFNKSQTTFITYPGAKAGSYTVPNSVSNIEDYAFYYCTGLISVAIGNSVTSIGNDTFAGCSSVTNITIGNGVTSIGIFAFNGCTSLTAITVDVSNSVFSSVDGVLLNQSQTMLIQYPEGKAGNYIIPNSVSNIKNYAFSGSISLTNVFIPNSITGIGDNAFSNCTRLTSITIPDSVTNIGSGAFEYCSSLTSVSIPNSISSIGDNTFFRCAHLTSITIPDSVTNIGNTAFEFCSSLTSASIPNSVNSIGSGAFSYSGLTSITIPGSVTVMSDAFQYCAQMTSAIICNGVTSIGAGAFVYSGLTNITIPNSVTNIEAGAFWASGLTSVTIPRSVLGIGVQAFIYCYNLRQIYFQGNAPGVDYSTFYIDYNLTAYYLPGTTGWSDFFGTTGLSNALWFLPNPLILNFEPNFGVQTNCFGFTISWATNIPVVVEGCTNLANPVWTPVGTNTLSGGTSYFSDSQWTNYHGRFYRLRSP